MLADRKYPLTLAALFGLYVVAGKLGLSLAFIHVSASPVWPPTGIALAALLTLGYRVWPAIFAGAGSKHSVKGPGAGASSSFGSPVSRPPRLSTLGRHSEWSTTSHPPGELPGIAVPRPSIPSSPVMHGCG